MSGRFQPGDIRINRTGRPKKLSVSEAIGGAISTTDIEKIASRMKVLALAGDASAGQACALFALVANSQQLDHLVT